MLRTLELPVLLQDAITTRANRNANLNPGLDCTQIFRSRQKMFTPVGLRATSVASRLRRECGFTESPLSCADWSAWAVPVKVCRRSVKEMVKYQSAENDEI